MKIELVKVEPTPPPVNVVVTISEREARLLKIIVGTNGVASRKAWLSNPYGIKNLTDDELRDFSRLLFSNLCDIVTLER